MHRFGPDADSDVRDATTRRSLIRRLGYGLALPLIPGATHAAAAATAAGASVLVAARDSAEPIRSVADFACDGKSDDVEIQAALDSLGKYGGSVTLAPGTYSISATVNINTEGTVLVAPGALLSQSSNTSGTALVSVNRSNCLVTCVRFRGPRGESSGTGIRLYGDTERGDAVNAVTIDKCRFDTLATAIEIGIVDQGSVGDCTISDVRIHRCGVGILSRGFTNRIYSPFISNTDIGIHQTGDRASGSFQLYGATINNWNAQAIYLERGRDFVIDSLWAERTLEMEPGAGPTEVVKIGSDQYEVANAHFTGVQSIHLPRGRSASDQMYVFYLAQSRGLVVDAIRINDQAPTAVVFQGAAQTGRENRIRRVGFGPGDVPANWDTTRIQQASAKSTGEVIVEQPADLAGSPPGAVLGTIPPGDFDYVVAQSESGAYYAKERNGNVAIFGLPLKEVMNAILGSNRHIHFTPGTFSFGADHAVFVDLANLTLSGSGRDRTLIENDTDEDADTEPFSFTRCTGVVVRDLTVSAAGMLRTTSDALDFDAGSDCLVERVDITRSRGRGIVFDGKEPGAQAVRNVIRDCRITGCPGAGIELLVAEHCDVRDCHSFGNGEVGLKVNRHVEAGRNSRFNRVSGGTYEANEGDGITVIDSDFTTIDGVRCLNNGRDGVRIHSFGGELTTVGTTVTSSTCLNDLANPAPNRQVYGINIVSEDPANGVVSSVISGNYLEGNLQGGIADNGTRTVIRNNVGQ
ncbi:MAG TPA: right-handed parallel beta-helix repeat-containing protein [Thermomicrobiales bacterium]|nr:right-handed parallel beta-helix repeat-containing protein [Thermomicrobiales bacterium]